MEKSNYSAFSALGLIKSTGNKTSDIDYNVVGVDINKIIPSKRNFYNTNIIDNLKAGIVAIGLQQNLTVSENEDGTYTLLNGHRRYKAWCELVEEGLLVGDKIPCRIVDVSEYEQRLNLILCNSLNREISAFEKMKQVQELKELALEMKEKDSALVPGRVRDYVAKMLDISSSEVGKLEAIDNNLNDELKGEFEQNNINTSVAYETSKLSDIDQSKVLEIVKEKKDKGEKVKADDVKNVFKLNTSKGEEVLEQTSIQNVENEPVEEIDNNVAFGIVINDKLTEGLFLDTKEDALNEIKTFKKADLNNDIKLAYLKPRKLTVSDELIDAEHILQNAINRASGNLDIGDENFLQDLKDDTVEELSLLLNKTLIDWIDKHNLQPNWFEEYKMESIDSHK